MEFKLVIGALIGSAVGLIGSYLLAEYYFVPKMLSIPLY